MTVMSTTRRRDAVSGLPWGGNKELKKSIHSPIPTNIFSSDLACYFFVWLIYIEKYQICQLKNKPYRILKFESMHVIQYIRFIKKYVDQQKDETKDTFLLIIYSIIEDFEINTR